MHICLLWVWNQSVWIFWICWAGTCMLFWFEKWFKQGKLESKSARIVFFKFRSVSNVVDNAEKAPRDACSMKEVMRNRGDPRNKSIYALTISAGSARWWSHHPGALALWIEWLKTPWENKIALVSKQSPNKILKWTYWRKFYTHHIVFAAKPDPTVHILVL